MRTLVTGGAGYFGTLLTEQLLSLGYEVRILDTNEPDQLNDSVEFINADIRDADAVREACAGVDVVHHNVAQVPLAKNRRLFHSVNYGGTENLLRCAIGANVGKVIYTSSSAVFGVPESNPVTEQTIPTPMEAYGRAKFEAEGLCEKYVSEGLDVSIVRPRTIMGHGRLGIFQILFEWVREGYNVPVLGKGDNVYQFVHAADLASACIKAGERAGPETYNIGAEIFGTMKEVLESLCKHAGTGSRVRRLPFAPVVLGMKISSALGLSPLGAYHALMYGRSMYFDIAKAKVELDWSPKFSNDEMFAESYDWYVQHRDQIMSNSATGSPHKSAVKQRMLGIVKYVL